MQFLLNETRMASNSLFFKNEAKKLLLYSEVILADIMVTEKQSDMERRNGSPCIITSHSFLFFSSQL